MDKDGNGEVDIDEFDDAMDKLGLLLFLLLLSRFILNSVVLFYYFNI
jgi:hypothetical protein